MVEQSDDYWPSVLSKYYHSIFGFTIEPGMKRCLIQDWPRNGKKAYRFRQLLVLLLVKVSEAD